MQLLLLRHRCASLSTGQDDGLHLLRDGELRTQGRCRRLEGGDTRRDVVIHSILIEVIHLLLDRAIDTGIAGVETDDEAAFIVIFLHQGKLLL